MYGSQPPQPPPAGLPVPNSGDPWAPVAAIVQQQVNAQVQRVNAEYAARLDKEIERITKELEGKAFKRVRNVVLTAIAAIVAAFSALAYAETRSLSQASSGFYNSVLQLQTQVIGMSDTIGERAATIAGANKELETATRDLGEARKELLAGRDNLARVTGDVAGLNTRLMNLATEYENRLKATLKPPAK